MLIFLLLVLEGERSRIKVVAYLVSDMGLFFDGISLLYSHVAEGKTSSSILKVSFSFY